MKEVALKLIKTGKSNPDHIDKDEISSYLGMSKRKERSGIRTNQNRKI